MAAEGNNTNNLSLEITMETCCLWPDFLNCTKCGRVGVAKLAQVDGWSFKQINRSIRIANISAGFTVVEGSGFAFGIDIICEACGISAWN